MSRRISFLLGAGASRDAGLPLAQELTEIIVDSAPDQQKNVLRFVKSGIEMQRAAHASTTNKDADTRVDSESLYNAIHDLIHRDTLDINPFVNSWHPFLSTFDAPPSRSAIEMERLLANYERELSGPFTRVRAELARALSGQSRSRSNLSQSLLDNIKNAVVQAVSVSGATDLSYLYPIFELARKHSYPLTVATLNYDQSIELAGAQTGTVVSDGISTAPGDREINFGKASVRLIKLHGSDNWASTEHGVSRIDPPDNASNFRDRAILFGGRNKLTAEWPFFELLYRWYEELEKCDDLCIIGYSYRDDHVNSLLRGWFEREPGRRAFLIDPTEYNDITHPLGWYVLSNSSISNFHWEPSANAAERRQVAGPSNDPSFIVIRSGAKNGLTELLTGAHPIA